MWSRNEKDKLALLVAGVFLLISLFLVFHTIDRHQSSQLLFVLAVAFLSYLVLGQSKNLSKQLTFIFVLGLAARLISFGSLPSLSDDVFRFLWDGRLIIDGINPFVALPSTLMETQGNDFIASHQALYQLINSKGYFTIYPPLNQLLFVIAAWTKGSLLFQTNVLRFFLLLAEIGTFFWIQHILSQKGGERSAVKWYWLNPLVIIELVGNLHFEALLIFFVIGAVYYLQKGSGFQAGLWLSLSVISKLLPLMLVPLFFWKLKDKERWIFVAIVICVVTISFAPLLSVEMINGFRDSFALYFQKFEFNASIFYVVREFGYWQKGWNIIETAGRQMAIISMITIILVSFKQINIKTWTKVIIIFMIYFLMTTTLHPWYITTVVALGVINCFRFPLIWSALIMMTYIGYTATDFQENLSITAIEYTLLFLAIGAEFFMSKKSQADAR